MIIYKNGFWKSKETIYIGILSDGEIINMMRIDEKRIFKIIEKRSPCSVALNGPEALIPKIQDTASHITEQFGIPAYVIGDACWGSCDLNTHAPTCLVLMCCLILGIPSQWRLLAKK